MNYLDIIIVVVVGYFLILGIRRGFVTMFCAIVGFLAALFVATSMMSRIALPLHEYIGLPKGAAYLIAYIILFVAVILLFKLAAKLIVKLFTLTSTRWVDRIGGAVFGLFLGILALSLILTILSFFDFTDRLLPEEENSLLYPYVKESYPYVYDALVKLKPAAQKFKDIIDDILKEKSDEELQRSQAGRYLLKYRQKPNKKVELEKRIPRPHTSFFNSSFFSGMPA